MSEQTRENKRAFDRAQLTKEQGKDRLRRANEKRAKSKNIEKVMANVGAFCVVQWHECVKCGRKQYLKNREISGDKCVRCSRTVFASGPIPIRAAICPKCGISHTAPFKNTMCKPCAKASHKETQRARVRRQGGRLRSVVDRARKHGVYIEVVKPSVVYKRDKWRCYLCGDKVIKSLVYHPKQATLDHVIPMAKGGSHTYDNIRCCCHECNWRKGTSMPESYKSKGVQLSLFTASRRGEAG